MLLVSVLFLCFILSEGKRFQAHDHVGIVANTVGPFNNPTETYPVSRYFPTSLFVTYFFLVLLLTILFWDRKTTST